MIRLERVFYNILFEFGVPMKLLRLVKMYLGLTYCRIRVDKNLFVMLCIRNNLVLDKFYSHCSMAL
jgi:hypothetical protein